MTDRTTPPKCGTCRFRAEPRYPGELWSSCVRILHGNGSEHGGLDWRPGDERAIVVDGSGYAARLLVMPAFGCVLHEPGPPAKHPGEDDG